MRILLLKPESNYPAIGLASVAAVLEKNNHKIKILDLGIYGKTHQEKEKILLDTITSFNPEVIGMTSLSSQWNSAVKFGSVIKQKHPEIVTIYGGPHVSQVPKEAIKNDFIDYIVVGEGEFLFSDLVKELEHNNKEINLPGVMYQRANEINYIPWKQYVEDMDSLPIPAYHLLDIERYQKVGETRVRSSHKRRYMPIMTTRGCPFNCFYCHKVFGRKFRVKNVQQIVEEIKFLYNDYNINEFHMEDDIFNANIKHAKELMQGIIDTGLKVYIKFPNGTRADCYDEELISLMKKAGVFRVILAFETMSPRLQKFIRKNLNLEKAKEAMYLFKKYKIETYGFFMIGFPTETKKELWSTIKFAVTSPLALASFSIVSPSPGTELYYYAIEHGLLKEGQIHASHSRAVMNLEYFSAKDLEKYRAKANLLFFLYPPRLLKLLFSIRDTRLVAFYWSNFRGKVLNVLFNK